MAVEGCGDTGGRMRKGGARRKNLLRKGSFLLALFLFQTFFESLFLHGKGGGGDGDRVREYLVDVFRR